MTLTRKEAIECIEKFLQYAGKLPGNEGLQTCPGAPGYSGELDANCEVCYQAFPKLRDHGFSIEAQVSTPCILRLTHRTLYMCPCTFFRMFGGSMDRRIHFKEVADFARRQMYGHGWGLKGDE